MTIRCASCGKEMHPQRSNTTTCSNACRSRLYKESGRRDGKKVTPVDPATVVKPVEASVTGMPVQVAIPGLEAPVISEPDIADYALALAVQSKVKEAGLEDAPEGLALVALAAKMSREQIGSAYAAMYRQLTLGLEKLTSMSLTASALDDLKVRRDRKQASNS